MRPGSPSLSRRTLGAINMCNTNKPSRVFLTAEEGEGDQIAIKSRSRLKRKTFETSHGDYDSKYVFKTLCRRIQKALPGHMLRLRGADQAPFDASAPHPGKKERD